MKKGKVSTWPTTRGKQSGQGQPLRPKAFEPKRISRRNEVRTAWATAVLAAVLAVGSLTYFLNSAGPRFQGRGAALADWLHAEFGPVGPAPPWLAISAGLALVSLAAARRWGKDVS